MAWDHRISMDYLLLSLYPNRLCQLSKTTLKGFVVHKNTINKTNLSPEIYCKDLLN